MRWRGRRQSDNIEDRRGLRVGRGAVGGGIGAIALALVAMYFGVDPSVVLQMAGGGGGETVTQVPVTEDPQEAGRREFVATMVADTETVWTTQFSAMRGEYRPPKVAIFRDRVQSECGTFDSGVGPFYCPADERVFLDMGFFDEMSKRLGAGGDFAHAYVIAHEVGHHVQNLLGISDRVHEMRNRIGEVEANQMSVRLELQADCFAGIFGNYADKQGMIEPGDFEEGQRAAAAIGDDRLQARAGRAVTPESFTHGTSEQRQRWLFRGIESGAFDACDTFKAADL